MAMIAMIALATLGVFASPASAQDETDCPEGTIPLLVVEPFVDGNDGTEFDEEITVDSTTVTISGTVDFHKLTFTSSDRRARYPFWWLSLLWMATMAPNSTRK